MKVTFANNSTNAFLFVGFVILMVVFGPFILVWALNTISSESHMGWNIPYNFWTWLCSLIVGGLRFSRK